MTLYLEFKVKQMPFIIYYWPYRPKESVGASLFETNMAGTWPDPWRKLHKAILFIEVHMAILITLQADCFA